MPSSFIFLFIFIFIFISIISIIPDYTIDLLKELKKKSSHPKQDDEFYFITEADDHCLLSWVDS